MVRLTVRVYSPPLTVRVSWFFQNKLTYFDLFYHFIMGKIGPKFSHLLTVRAEGADPPPPPPPLTVSLAVKIPGFFTALTSLLINAFFEPSGPQLSGQYWFQYSPIPSLVGNVELYVYGGVGLQVINPDSLHSMTLGNWIDTAPPSLIRWTRK